MNKSWFDLPGRTMKDTFHANVYFERARIFLRLRFSLRIRFFLH